MIFAEAIFCNPGSLKIIGSVSFSQYNENFVRVDIDLINVPLGIHGIHVHKKQINFSKETDYCQQAGEHFNGSFILWSPDKPNGTPHGSYAYNTDRHIGDLCNNIVSINGTVKISFIDNLISLIPKHPHCILDKSVIIHDEEDDNGLYIPINSNENEIKRLIESRITGNAGKRIACANIMLT